MNYFADRNKPMLDKITKYLNKLLDGKLIDGYEMQNLETGSPNVHIKVSADNNLVSIASKMHELKAVRTAND